MKIVVFAGGVGTRLWPLSRKSSPKQFEKVVGEKSTLQLCVERLYPDFSSKDIYISTGQRYVDLVKKQLPDLPTENIIGEPEMRDVCPAVGLATAIIGKTHPTTPIAILWSDHIVKKEEMFRKVLKRAEEYIKLHNENIVFISQKPRFASQNLGWIEFGEKCDSKEGIDIYRFKSLLYRPNLKLAERFMKSGHHTWNLGYFVTTPKFLLGLYKKHVPQMYGKLIPIQNSYGGKDFIKTVEGIYPTLEKISFDNAILEKLGEKDGVVISEDLEWSDVGAWEALKEALQTSPEQNVTQGKVLTTDSRDSLVYNYTDQLLVTIDLEGYLVVNTHDVVLVCKKTSVPKIKKLVEGLSGTENEHLT